MRSNDQFSGLEISIQIVEFDLVTMGGKRAGWVYGRVKNELGENGSNLTHILYE